MHDTTRNRVRLGPRRGRRESPSQLRAMERFGIRRRETFRTEQTHRDYVEFLAKLSTQGPVAIERAREFAKAEQTGS